MCCVHISEHMFEVMSKQISVQRDNEGVAVYFSHTRVPGEPHISNVGLIWFRRVVFSILGTCLNLG